MVFRVLGPVRLWAGDTEVDVGSGKQRCVLAVLVVGVGRPHQVEALIDRVWGEDPPAQVRSALYSYISRLRRVLREVERDGDGREIALRQRAGGYVLDAPANYVDLHRFGMLTNRARAAEDAAQRLQLFREALGLWTGTPLQDVSGLWAEQVRQSLQRQRVRVCVEYARHLIELECYAEADDLLEQELAANPLAESLASQLMVSLQSQGRQAEALDCYAALRHRLNEDLGVEPGPVLQELHTRILRGEPPAATVVGSEPPQSWRDPASPARVGRRLTTGGRLPPAVEPDLGQAPYLGLETFQPEHAALLFGRQDLVDELLARVAGQRFLAVFGPSGSGKSSVLRAGLLARIRDQKEPGFAGWATVLCSPGEHPLRELAARLAALAARSEHPLYSAVAADPAGLGLLVRQAAADSGEPALVLIDQFEEIFTLCTDLRERAQFIEALLSLVDNESVPVRVVIGIRADFYGSCAEFPALVALLRDQQLLVGPMGERELRSVITGPAGRAGLTVEPALVDTVLADVVGESAALPMLSHALLETWRRREGNLLTVRNYQRAGGVRGAIAQTADRVYAGFDVQQRRLAREVFLRLTVPVQGPDDTRRRASRTELLGRADADDIRTVLDRLASARLITLDEDTVTVVHESLIRGWPTLRSWIDEDRERLRAHRRLTETAAEWNAQARDDGLLYRGSSLAAWTDRDSEQLNDLEQEFLGASRRQAAWERLARRRRVRTALVGLSTALAVVLILATVAFVQADQARQERDRAFADRLVTSSRSQLPLDPELAVLLARRAFEIDPSGRAESALAQALVESRIRASWPTGQRQSIGVDFSPDGRWVAAAGDDHTVRIRPVAGDREPIVLRGHDDRVLDVAFNPDGRRVASASEDETVRIWPMDGASDPTVLRGPKTTVHAVVWRPDGRQLATGSEDGAVRLWPADGTGPPTVLSGHTKRALGVAYSPDGSLLASASGDTTIRIWQSATGKTITTLHGHGDTVEDIAFGPDGQRVVTGSTDGTIRVWPIDGTTPPIVLAGHQGTVETVAFSHDGLSVASGGNDRTARVWQSDGSGDPVVLRGIGGPIWSVAFSPDNRLLATAGDEGTVRLWDPRARPQLRTLPGHNGPVWATALNPDGTRVAAACDDGTIRIHRTDGSGEPVLLTGHSGPVQAIDFSPDGQRVASAGDDGTVRIWHASGDDNPPILTGHDGIVFGVAFAPDGTHVVSGGTDATVRVWPTSGDQAPVVLHTNAGYARDVTVSLNGEQVASANRNGTVTVWRLAQPDPPTVLPTGHDGLVWSVAFSPTGHDLAAASNDGTVRIWRLSGDPISTVLTGHDGLAWSATFSPDGHWLASTGNDHTVRLWPTDDKRDPIVFTSPDASFEGISVGPDGDLAVGRDNGTVEIWRCEACLPTQELLELATRRTTRDFTPAERDNYLNGL